MVSAIKMEVVALVALAASGMSGCSLSPRVEFTRAVSERVEKKGRLEAVNFRADFNTSGLQGQQLVFTVQLFDRGRQWIKSKDGRYETKSGIVGASKTLFVFKPDETFRNVVVSIPAGELGITQKNLLPIFAAMGVFRADGGRLAIIGCQVPIQSVKETLPPLATQSASSPATKPASTTAYWFVKPRDGSAFPVFRGPYRSLREASRSVRAAEDPPVELQGRAVMWFVPIYFGQDPSPYGWCGPCASQDNSWDVASAMASCVVYGSGLEIGNPTQLTVEEGMARRANPRELGLLCAESPAR